MTEELQVRQRRRSKLWIAALALAILVSLIVIPPLVSINRYKTRIAAALSASLGRPVHLSGVELRLFPRPGFVISNLTVEEDPAYGAEPVLHANEVTAAVRLWSLWRGRLEISRISVDEASLNLVRTADGRWNLDTLFRIAAQSHSAPAAEHRKTPLPYLEATNSRINVKRGYEKLPYSLVNADLSFWEENPGDWRLRLKGQPARTDVEIQLGDTGIVQLEARIRRASELRLMPVHIEMEWREAQLGQLSRLLIGSDPGWRGDLTADLKLDGTADSAQVNTRLRASGVHRAEFAPAVPLDFDANCTFGYHYSARTLDNLACDSPLGDGRLRLAGTLPSDGRPKVSLELDHIPAQAILDTLRTVRSEFGAGLDADGSLTGKLSYDPQAIVQPVPPKPASTRTGKKRSVLPEPVPPATPLSGSISVDGLKLTGGSLNQPIQIQKIVLEPAPPAGDQGEGLSGTATLSAGAPTPLTFSMRFSLRNYRIAIHGSGTPARVRQIAQAAGLKEAPALDAIAGDPVSLDLAIEGPWLPAPEEELAQNVEAVPSDVESSPAQVLPDRLTGTVTLRNARWKADSLPTAVEITQATLHLNGGASDWDPVAFTYGPLKGIARVQIPAGCATAEHCEPAIHLDFQSLDAAEMQSALLGSQKKGTLLSTVIARLTPSSQRTWPSFRGSVKAGSLILGPVTLDSFAADVTVASETADINSLDAGFLGGQVHLTGKIENGDKPAYSLEGSLQNLSPSEICRILALKCTGSSLDGDGKIELAGFEGTDLKASAKGSLHFVWKKGGVSAHPPSSDSVSGLLAHFDNWTGDLDIASGKATLAENKVIQGKRSAAVAGSITLDDPAKAKFSLQKPQSATAHPDTIER